MMKVKQVNFLDSNFSGRNLRVKIEEMDDKYIKFSEVNNQKPEINEHILSNGQKSYSLVIKDFLKYPDEFSSLLGSFPHFKNEKEFTGRPGKSFLFNDSNFPKLTFFIRKSLFEIFKINFECISHYTNCFSGIMDTHMIPPHTDIDDPSNLRVGPHLVSNLGLTKNSKGGTSFWTFMKKRGVIDMNIEELNRYFNQMSDITFSNKNDIKHWENSEENGEWKFEYFVPWGYNDLVVYSPTLFHQPYFKKEWFLKSDRFSLASFYTVKTEDIAKIPQELRADAYDAWKKFEICKLLNFYF